MKKLSHIFPIHCHFLSNILLKSSLDILDGGAFSVLAASPLPLAVAVGLATVEGAPGRPAPREAPAPPSGRACKDLGNNDSWVLACPRL